VSVQSSAGITEGVQYHSSVKEGSKFRWIIEVVRTVNNNSNWIWKWGNFVSITQGEYMTLEWKSAPSRSVSVNTFNALDYSGAHVQVGSRILNNTRNESFFNFFIAPLYITSPLGTQESGFNALERIWFNSYHLPSADFGIEYSQYVWNFDMENGSLSNIGKNGKESTIVFGHITTPNFFSIIEPETYVFDVAYESKTGILKWLRFPSKGLFDFPIANSSHKITEGLTELVISFVDSESVPAYELPVVLLGFIIITRVVTRRKGLK
jgi:hypothetical protein